MSYKSQDWTAERLFEFASSRSLIVPWFQRTVVWKAESKKFFIDTLKKDWPFGALLVYKHPGAEERYSIVDGLQRTSTVQDYYKNPTKYFEKEHIPSTNLRDAANALGLSEDVVGDTVTAWVSSQKLTAREITKESSSKGFDITGLAKYLVTKYGGKLDDYIDGAARETSLRGLVDAIGKAVNIDTKIIPVIEFSADAGALPDIFKRLNKEGQPLSETDVLAASWDHSSVGFTDVRVSEIINRRYRVFKDLGFEVELTEDEQKSFFLYLYGLGKVLQKDYPTLFKGGDQKEDDVTLDDIAFKLLCYCQKLDISNLAELQKKIFQGVSNEKKGEVIDKIQSDLKAAIDAVQGALAPFLDAKFNQIESGKFNPPHADYLMVAIIAKMYLVREDSKGLREFIKNLPYRYFFEIISGRWRGSGNTRAKEVVDSPNKNFLGAIEPDLWRSTMREWMDDLQRKEEKERANIPGVAKLFLRYIYSDVLTVRQDRGEEKFHIEHLVPVKRLQILMNGVAPDGLPISHPGNLAILPESINTGKKDLTVYQYADSKESTEKLVEEIEKYTFTTRSDLDFVERINENMTSEERKLVLEEYMTFIKKRGNHLAEVFLGSR